MPMPSFADKQQRYYLIHRWDDNEIRTFSKGISLKMNVIERLEFELAYSDVTVLHVSHYTTDTPPHLQPA